VAATFLGLFFLDIALHIPVYTSPCLTTDCNNPWLVSAAEVRVLESWGLTDRVFSFFMRGTTVINLVVVLVLAVVILLFPNGRFKPRWAKYDADKIPANFSNIVRQQVDLDKLSAELAYVAQETIPPEHLSLWIRSIYSVTPRDILQVKEHANG
jgi:hypothetical protein